MSEDKKTVSISEYIEESKKLIKNMRDLIKQETNLSPNNPELESKVMPLLNDKILFPR